MTDGIDTTTTTTTTTATSLRALRVAAAVTFAVVVLQFVSAGQLLGPDGPAGVHAAGAVVLHVASLLTAGAAAWHRRSSGGPAWPVVLGVAVFAATFVQAALGDRDTLWAHVPGALVLAVGSVLLLAWSTRPHGAR